MGGVIVVYMRAEKSLSISGMNAKLTEIMRHLTPPSPPEALADFSHWSCPHSLLSSPSYNTYPARTLVLGRKREAPRNSSVTPMLSRAEACQNPMIHQTVSS